MLFGAIVQWFACHEILIREIMACVTGTDTACIRLLNRGLDFGATRAALHDLLRHQAIPLTKCDKINAYLLVADTHRALLHDILHSAWISGKPSNSVQPDWILGLAPTIKPMHSDADTHPGNFVERYEDKVSYTVDDLLEIVDILAENHKRFSTYLIEAGLTHQHGKVG